MKHRLLLLPLLPLLSALALPAVAHAADHVGSSGTIARLDYLEPSSDVFIQYHGRMFIDSFGRSTEYRWGGTSCGSKVLSEAEEDRLQRAMDVGATVTPLWQPGQGGTKCVVGVRIEL